MQYEKYLGLWINTLRENHTIARFTLFEEDGRVMMETEVTGSEKSWGKTPVALLGQEGNPEKIIAFEVCYEMPQATYQLSIYDSKGLLVVGAAHITKEGSGRKSIFTREFFYKA